MQKNISTLLIGKGLPNYKEITPDEVNSSMPCLLKQLNKEFDALEKKIEKIIRKKGKLDWWVVMEPLQEITERLRWSWGVISHLNGVCNSNELRDAYSSQQSDVIRFSNRVGQSKQLYEALCVIKSSPKGPLDITQKRILENELLSMKHKGVGLPEKEKVEFNSITESIAKLSTNFSNNVLDSTQEWSLLITDSAKVKGLPSRTLEALAETASASKEYSANSGDKSTPEEGPWLITLDMPTYIAVITYADNRALREKIYKAYISRASSGKLNNQEIIKKILCLRKQQANLLGYKNWADLSLATKMAQDVKEVEILLEELREASMLAAKKELKELQKLAAKMSPKNAYKDGIAPWDVSYLSEKLRQEKFNLNQESLRPWFPLPQVLKGLFQLSKRLFDISIEQEFNHFPKWHKDVQLFNVLNSNGEKIASFYLDPYSRPSSKRGGAWMDECLNRDATNKENIVLPVAYLICNQTPPVGGKPSLMSFDEVKTLFHEFGHGLQHMLTNVDYPQAAGINNVEWDAVELPSQFMENWCLDKTTIQSIAKHWQTGEPLPNAEYEKLKKSQTFNSGLTTLRQVCFALTDIKLHSEWDEKLKITPDAFRRHISKYTTVIEPIKEDQFLCAFSHIFAGGYSAGYYSYKWAEVLSADAFSAFEEVGLDKEEGIRKKGILFRDTVLSLGGSRTPKDIFNLFRGRPANTKALIRHSGLVSTN